MSEKTKSTETEEVPTLDNPYEASLTKPDFRLNVDVMEADIMLIKSLVPSRGAVQYLVSSYVKSLADEIRELGLHYSPENIERFKSILERRNQFTTKRRSSRQSAKAG